MATLKCPVCGVSVKAENLDRHLKNQHPHASVDTEALLSDEDREAVRRAKSTSRPALTSGGKRMIVVLAIAVVAIIVIAVLVTTLGPGGPSPGQTAPSFSLGTSDGGTISLTGLLSHGQPVFLEFMSPFCPYCQQEAPTLASVYQSYGSRVQFASIVLVNFPDGTATNANVNQFRTQYGTSWPYGMDTTGSVANAYGATSTPTAVLITRTGSVAQRFVGTSEGSAANLIAAFNTTLGG
jgi:cytochrome c biogenesis protein CcmG, thiol:disulfide interchange protein DsbE